MTTIPLHPGLLRAICEQPDDTGLRLIAADWLEEMGETAWSEFLRVQVELANIGHLHPPADDEDRAIIQRHHQLRRRERELLESCNTSRWEQWFPIASLGPAFLWSPRRGFVEIVTCRCADWLAHGSQIVQCQPIREVRLTDQPPPRSPIDFGDIPLVWARQQADLPIRAI